MNVYAFSVESCCELCLLIINPAMNFFLIGSLLLLVNQG